MKETFALLMGFSLLAGSGRFLYRGCTYLCSRLLGSTKEASPIAMVLTGFTLCTLFLFLIFGYTVLIVGQPLSIGSLLLSILLILLVDNILIFAGYLHSQRQNRLNISDQLVFQKQQTEVNYYRTLEEQYDRQRVLIHDIRRHLGAIRSLAEAGNGQEVARYVKELEDSPALQHKVRICGNHILDVILCRYEEICQSKEIRFHVDIRSGSVEMLNQSDLTSLFGNLLENAVEAAEGVENGYIDLFVEPRPEQVFQLTMVNSCNVPPKTDSTGKFITAKQNREYHGLGLKSVRNVTEKYSGALRQYYEEESKLFHTIILMK